MEKLDQNIRLNKLNIPRTHNSGAIYDGFSGDIANTQTLTIEQQLSAGIRFMDIRLRDMGNGLFIYQDLVYQNLSFSDVLSSASVFLDDNPSETIEMRVQEKHTPSNNTQGFKATVKSYTESYPI